MEGTMDVLPFSLSCDRCDFRTKSMSAMRHHAQTHHSEHHEQQPIEEIGINNHASNDDHALQALVDSALNDASRLLLSSTDNHHHHHQHLHQDPNTARSRSSVEEVGRTDGDGDLGHQDRKTERVVTPRASALAAEDLLGIYAAGIDFSVVGGGGVVEDSHFRAGCSQEVPAMTSAEMGENTGRSVRSRIAIPSHEEAACRVIHSGTDVGGNSGIATDGRDTAQFSENCSGGVRSGKVIPSHDEVACRVIHSGTDVSGTATDGRDTAQFSENCSGNPMEADSSRTANPNQSIQTSGGIDPKRTGQDTNSLLLSESSESTSISKNRTSGQAHLPRCKIATRPVFQFVIHRSAFSKTLSPDDDTPSSSSKHGRVRSRVRAEQAECHTSSASHNTLEKDTDSGSIAMTTLRTRGQRTKLVLADERITAQDSASGKRRGRKLACPLKVILSKRKAPSTRGGRATRTPGRPRKNEWQKMKYVCPECSFSCMYKKDLTAHTKLVHTKNARKNPRVGKMRFEINNSKTSQSLSEKTRHGSRRTSRKKGSYPCINQDEEDVPSKPKQLSTTLNKGGKILSKVGRKPTKDRNPIKIESDEQEEENESAQHMDDVWVPTAADVSSSDGEALDSGREADGDDGVCNICHKFIADCPADLKRHKAEIHCESSRLPKLFRCTYCNYSTQFRKTLTAHIHDLHGDAVQLLTEKTTEPKAKPKKKEVDTSRVYRCNICTFSCHSSHLLNSHMKSAHNFEKMSGEFTCNVCGKVIVGRYSHFRRHLRCHSDERPFKCDQCPLAFRDSNSLNCHVPIHKEERDYLCEDCGMAFKRPINLRMHRKVHSDKMFPCDECDYKCRRRNTLLNHKKRKHLKQKTVLCQHCGHRFFSKTECKNHVMKKHTQRPTPFACPICPAVFMFQYRFKAHLKTHPEIKPYKCHFCGFETRLNTYLMDHMRQHTGEKPKKCSQCDYETSTNSNLYKHRKRHHGPGIPRLGSRTRKPRLMRNKDGNAMGASEEQKQRAEKSVVEDIVNAVEFSQIASQVNLAGSQAAAAMFNMATMCSTHEFKQEQLMQVPPTDAHQGPPMLPDEVNIISSVSDTSHDADRLSISILDKTTSSVAAMMEALADARNMRPTQVQASHQPNHQTIMSHPSAYPIHLATTPQSTAHPNTTSSALSAAPVFPRSVAAAAMAANMTMHYVHPNIGAIGPGGGNYHHLSALAGEAAARSPITSHGGQPTPHNVTIPPPLIGVGQGQATPQPLTHFSNMMHY